MVNSDNLDVQTQDSREGGGADQAQDAKTFTQAEVDEIVSKRLARERRRAEQDSPQDSREKDLEARELKVMAKEKLIEKGLPVSLADVLRYSDEKTLETAVETIRTLNQEAPKAWGARLSSGPRRTGRDPVKEAMGLTR